MPNEVYAEDCDWKPGPIDRPLPPFHGPKPGPTNPELCATSPPSAFLATQLTPDFVEKVILYTTEHCMHWRTANTDKAACGVVERSMLDYRKKLTPDFFYLWLAVRLRIACLKPEIAAELLWTRSSHLFDVQVFNAMTIHQFKWMNRHCAFAEFKSSNATEDDADSDVDSILGQDPADECADAVEPKGFDSNRKRRELTDSACVAFGAAWHPHQHLGVDEAVRSNKHWGKMRIRFKASVHSGSLVDELNDCTTKYCLWFEEHHWLHAADFDEDPNTVKSRLLRAASVLMDKGKLSSPCTLCSHLLATLTPTTLTHLSDSGTSTSNYCINMDRGYGHVEAQDGLAIVGIYSNSIMDTRRVGLPRKFLAQLETELKSCEPDDDEAGSRRGHRKCTHGPEELECRKFTFTALHKFSNSPTAPGAQGAQWELNVWQDAKMITSYGNFFSAARAGLLTRGSHGSRHSYQVWAPEAIWHYNVQGRSATDGSDQLRKKMCIAERRILRAGNKGISFVFDIAFTNAAIMWQFLQPEDMPRWKRDNHFNKVRAYSHLCLCILPN